MDYSNNQRYINTYSCNIITRRPSQHHHRHIGNHITMHHMRARSMAWNTSHVCCNLYAGLETVFAKIGGYQKDRKDM